jgi:type IV secretory pathway VirB4 component
VGDPLWLSLHCSFHEENHRLASLVQFLDGTEIGGVAERLRPWVGEGRFAWAFDNREDSLVLDLAEMAILSGTERLIRLTDRIAE